MGANPHHYSKDASVVYRAYKHRDLEGLRRIDGDFAAAIWDEEKHEMHCIRDHFGQQPLFYFHNEHVFLYASSITLLTAHPAVYRKPNLQALASLSTDPNNNASKERTFFDGIKSVLPASVLTVSAKGIKQRSYWSPSEIIPEHSLSEEEHLSEIANRFTKTVASRIPERTPAFALLSGGLDSSAVVATAAKYLEQHNRKLRTLSAVKENPLATGLQEEESYIHCFSSNANIDMRLVRSADRGPFDNIESMMQNSSEPIVSSRHYLYSAFAEEISQAGGYTVLDGRFGELGPTANGTGIMLEWLLKGNWTTFWQELRATASVRNTTLWQVARTHILRVLLTQKMQPNTSATNQLLNEQFVKTHVDTNGPQAEKLKVNLRDHRAIQLQYLNNAQKTSRIVGFDGFKKIQIALPFLDRRLLELCVSAPASLKQHQGYNRYTVRAMLKNVLPEPIRLRTSKAPFSVDYNMRYTRQHKLALDYVSNIGSKDPVRAVVNVSLLEKWLNGTTMNNTGSTHNSQALHFVPSAIYTIAFLRQFSEFR